MERQTTRRVCAIFSNFFQENLWNQEFPWIIEGFKIEFSIFIPIAFLYKIKEKEMFNWVENLDLTNTEQL